MVLTLRVLLKPYLTLMKIKAVKQLVSVWLSVHSELGIANSTLSYTVSWDRGKAVNS